MTLVLAIAAAVGYVAVLWVALAFYVVRDARRRSSSIVFALFAALLGFFPPFLGTLLYLVVRPPRTLEEERSLALEEQAYLEPLKEGPEVRPCPSCGREVEEKFVLCPYCRTQFARRCPVCEHSLRLGWSVCPYCATEVGVQPLGRTSRSAS